MKDLAFELYPKVRAKFLYSKMRGNNISPEGEKKTNQRCLSGWNADLEKKQNSQIG